MSRLFEHITQELEVPTFNANIYLAGPIEVAEQIIRRECLVEGLCVTITPTTYIYSGGEESGYVVGLINYPRFPKSPEEITDRAIKLGKIILDETYQQSLTVVTSDKTYFISKR